MTGDNVLSKFSALLCGLSHLVAGLLARKIVATTEDYAHRNWFCRLFRKKLEFIDVPVPNWPQKISPYRSPVKPYKIGFVGRIAPEKSLEVLLQALDPLKAKLGPDFTLEFVGPIESGMYDLVSKYSDERVIFRGRVSDEELDQFYHDIDVLVLPSNNRIEAFGLVQVEAMLRGTPCVTSDRPGMRQPVSRTGFGYLFEPGNSEALAGAIFKTLSDGPETIPSRSQLASTFSSDKICESYERLYLDITGG